MSRGAQQTFLQRKHTDGQKAHEKMLSLTIREMQIKTIKRYSSDTCYIVIDSTNEVFSMPLSKEYQKQFSFIWDEQSVHIYEFTL